MPNQKDLVEIFGYRPDDMTEKARSFWQQGTCPYIDRPCIKCNHDKSVIYGVCSVTSPHGDVIICPNRLYEKNYHALREVSWDAFGKDVPFLMYDRYLKEQSKHKQCVVALGMNSGKEVQVGHALSMDWVLAKIVGGKLYEYVGIEVQSIDITGNYRDAWGAYRNLPKSGKTQIPPSAHGLNWANVHKRLIPQLIRKGRVYTKSHLAKKGMYFIVPEAVYQKFEEIIGDDIKLLKAPSGDSLTVHTYGFGRQGKHGTQRGLSIVRKLVFSLDEFSQRFISGANLPSGEELDSAVKKILGVG